MNKKEQQFHDKLRQIGCVICREFEDVRTDPEIHHISQGSGERSHYMCAPLCVSHHRIGVTSLHGAGVKRFLSMHGLPTEFHLLELVNKFRAEDGV
ncbi:MAG: Ref family recombination enhancement nuclease [Patescibacteria group bacterium]